MSPCRIYGRSDIQKVEFYFLQFDILRFWNRNSRFVFVASLLWSVAEIKHDRLLKLVRGLPKNYDVHWTPLHLKLLQKFIWKIILILYPSWGIFNTLTLLFLTGLKASQQQGYIWYKKWSIKNKKLSKLTIIQ